MHDNRNTARMSWRTPKVPSLTWQARGDLSVSDASAGMVMTERGEGTDSYHSSIFMKRRERVLERPGIQSFHVFGLCIFGVENEKGKQ